LHGGDFLRDIGFQPEGALHLPILQVVRLPSWGGSTSRAATAPLSSQPVQQASGSGRQSKLTPAQARQPNLPLASQRRGQSDFMDMVREFNEGSSIPQPSPGSETPDLLQRHLHKETPAIDPSSELLAAIASRPTLPSRSTSQPRPDKAEHLRTNILEDL
ncbi:unnamed protein product, partial [Symbiodinium pilosum]